MSNHEEKDRVKQIEADVQRLLRELEELKASEAEKSKAQEQKVEKVEELLAEKATAGNEVPIVEKELAQREEEQKQKDIAKEVLPKQDEVVRQATPEAPEQKEIKKQEQSEMQAERTGEAPIRKKKSIWQELKEALFDEAGDTAREERMGGKIELPRRQENKPKEEVETQRESGREKVAETEPIEEKIYQAEENREIEVPTELKSTPKVVKPKRTFEENVKFLMPKVFMIIFILGILWGLKLASDYGYLTDHFKVFGSFALSIGLGALAHYLDSRQKTLQAFLITMYGGSFIIGILATAAGAILYEILPLMLALVIVVVYIIYGIYLSYIKANEVLTGFVLFTSFLLPYLLEYMQFDMVVILAYIVILFLAMQIVILKHQQHVVLYLGFLLSFLSIYLMWTMQEMIIIYPAASYLIVNGIFLVSWMDLHANSKRKWYNLQLGFLFILSVLGLYLYAMIVTYLSGGSICLFALLVLYAAATFVLYQRKLNEAVEVNLTISFLIAVATIFALEEWIDYRMIFLAIILFVGMMLGIHLRAPAMKLLNGLFLTLTMIRLQEVVSVKPFFNVDHIALFLVFTAMITSYVFAKRQKKGQLKPFEVAMEKYYLMEVILSGIVLFLLMYLMKLDFAYLSIGSQVPHFAYIFLVFAAVIALTIEPKYVGKVLPIALVVIAVSAGLGLNAYQSYGYTDYIFFRILTSLAFIGSVLAVLADLFYEGKIYHNYEKYLKKYIEIVFIVGFFLWMTYLMNLSMYLYQMQVISEGLHTIWMTITIFLTASISLIVDAFKQWRKLKIFGYVILGVAIFKLIFYDLATLDLFIRAILFIIIGGVGMFLSAKLLKNEKE